MYNVIDDLVLRGYVAFTNHLESRGHDRYDLAAKLEISNLILGDIGMIATMSKDGKSPPMPPINFESIPFYGYANLLGIAYVLNLGDSIRRKIGYVVETDDTKDQFHTIVKTINQPLRLFCLGLGLYHLYLASPENSANSYEAMNAFSIGAFELLLASSMYLKDSDLGKLEKESQLEKAFNKLIDYFRKLALAPVKINY